MSELKLKNCPFCNCTMSVRSNRDWHRPEGDHEDHCPVDDTVLMYPATDIGLSALVNCWNTRVTQPEATKPAQDLDERNTQGPLLIARIKRYKEAFDCSTAEAKEACEYGRDLNSDQAAFVSPTKKDLSAAIPDGWREFIENIATPCSEPLNSVSGYRDLASRKEKMGELRAKARALLASSADALSAGDRVDVITDTQRMDFQQANPHMYFNVDKRGKRWRFGHFSNYPQDCYGSAREALDAAIQAQKDGHG